MSEVLLKTSKLPTKNTNNTTLCEIKVMFKLLVCSVTTNSKFVFIIYLWAISKNDE